MTSELLVKHPSWQNIHMGVEKNSEAEVRAKLEGIYKRLWRYAFALSKSRDSADDIAQATCLKALEKAEQFQTGTHFDRWVFRIAQRLWLNELRSSATRRGTGLVPVDDMEFTDTRPTPEMNILNAEVLTSVLELNEQHRSVVFLAYVEGYSYKECAEILGIPIGTVMSRLAAARRKISTKFTSEGQE